MRKKFPSNREYRGITMKKKEEVISVLKEKRSYIIQKYHITRIGIFGSVIRDEAGPGSDKDILVDFSDDAGLLDHSGLKIYLEKHKIRIGMGLFFVKIPGRYRKP